MSRPIAITAAPPRSRPVAAAAIGLAAGALAVAVGHLVAALSQPSASPLLAVGSAFIDLTPEWLKTFAIATFGENDKAALIGGIVATLALAAIAIGLVGTRSRLAALGGIGILGVVGAVAAVSRPTGVPSSVVPSLVGAIVGGVALLMLFGRLGADARPRLDAPSDAPRRRVLGGLVGVALLAIASGGAGILLSGRRAAAAVAGAGSAPIPVPMEPLDDIAAGVDLGLDGVAPFFTPNDAFYRVDTALEVPVIAAADWRLRIHGLVDREVTFTLDDLLALPVIERDITLTCVSNVVGGRYVGNARWIGVPLATVLGEAGVQAGADQIVSRSIDGMTIGTPTAVALDGRDAMLAVAMNGEPLPAAHGYPVRLVVPGLYGYVSATKWVVDLELTTFDAFDAYWVQRGWSADGPIRTMARIDTPKPLADLAAGRVAVGGVAWAQHTGISAVEVRVDGGDWVEARLGDLDTIDTWRQWSWAWDATPGTHTLEVRATDGSGQTQTDQRAEPFPRGATGWHSVVVRVA